MALPAAIQAIVTRFRGTNNNAYSAANNPLGMGQGGQRQNFPPRLKDMADALHFVSDQIDLSSANVEATAADVLLTAEDAENTRLDRIATAENVGLAAGEVGKAAAEANRSRDEADRAAGFAAGVNLPGITAGDALKFLRAKADGSGYENAEVDLYSAALIQRVARSSNTQIVKADKGKLFVLTGSFTQTVASPADLGDGHHYLVKNAGTGNITIPASDGRTNWIMYPGEMRLFQCDGTTLRSEVLWPFSVAFTTNTVFVPPPGYAMFRGFGWGGGGGGFNASDGNTNFGVGGSLGGSGAVTIRSEQLSPSENVTVGAGGAAGTPSSRPGQAGGATTIGSFAFAGGFGGATAFQGSAMRSSIGANLVEGQGAPGIPASINVPGLPGMVPGGGGQGSSNSFAAAAGARGELRLWGVV